jgi:two-component system, response regulator
VDGFEVLRKVRADERTNFLPVMMLTSSSEEQHVARVYGLGANSFIRKLVDFQQFAAAVRQLGLYWLVLNQSPRSRITSIDAGKPTSSPIPGQIGS